MRNTFLLCVIIVIVMIVFAILIGMGRLRSTLDNMENAKQKKQDPKIIEGGGPMSDFKTGIDIGPILGSLRQEVPIGSKSKPKSKKSKKSKKNNTPLARRLKNAGWKLYVKDTCPWCHLQIDMFGNDRDMLEIINCSSEDLRPVDMIDCSQTWVYPTWVNGDRVLPGSQNFKSLNRALRGKGTVSRKTYRKMSKD